jgi:hypothetical protein
MLRLYGKLSHSRTDRERLEAKATRATVYIARNGRGQVIGAR